VPHPIVIVDNENSHRDRRHSGGYATDTGWITDVDLEEALFASGRMKEMVVPPWFDSIFMWPPNCRTRSRIPVIPTPEPLA